MSSGFKVGDMLEERGNPDSAVLVASEFTIEGERFLILLDSGGHPKNPDSYTVVKDSDWGTSR